MVLQDERERKIWDKESTSRKPGTKPAGKFDDTGQAPITIEARKARGAGLGFETKKEGIEFAVTAGIALLAIVTAAVITSVTA